MKKLLFLVFVALFLFSCGGSDKAKPEKMESMPEKKMEVKEEVKEEANAEDHSADHSADAAANENMTVVTIEGNDMMKFNMSEIKVPAGKEVKLILKHTGKIADNVMGHNWVLLKEGTDMNAFAAEATKAKDQGYIPNDGKDTYAYTSVIGGGETTEVTFMPPAAGEYTFVCSFPGHFGAMQGKFIVE